MAENGLVSIQSNVSASTTVDRLLAALAARKLTVFAHVDHAAAAAAVGLKLRPTELIIFGNPQGGTALMQDRQTAGIDLPLKALVWEAADGTAWLAYNDPAWLAQRHGLGAASAAATQAMTTMLAAVAREVTK